MKLPLSAICALAVAAGVALASTRSVLAAPLSVPGRPATFSDVVKVQDSAKIIRRDNSKGGDAWKKRAGGRGQLHRDGRREARTGQGRNHIHRPKATPKYAYDAEGNFRVYDGNRPTRELGWKHLHGHADSWSHRDDWEDWGQWDERHRRRPHRSKMDSFGYQQPSPALKPASRDRRQACSALDLSDLLRQAGERLIDLELDERRGRGGGPQYRAAAVDPYDGKALRGQRFVSIFSWANFPDGAPKREWRKLGTLQGLLFDDQQKRPPRPRRELA